LVVAAQLIRRFDDGGIDDLLDRICLVRDPFSV